MGLLCSEKRSNILYLYDNYIVEYLVKKKGTVILGCESEGEMEELKVTVQDKLGKDYSITKPKGVQPKIKIINVSEEEMTLDDENLISVIMKQNKLDEEKEGVHMRVIKKIVKEGRNENTQSRRGRENGSLILEMDI